jgi:hypothetical protein
MSFTSNSSTSTPKGKHLTPNKGRPDQGAGEGEVPPDVSHQPASDYASGLDEDDLRGARMGDPSDIANDVLAAAQGGTQMADDSGSMVCADGHGPMVPRERGLAHRDAEPDEEPAVVREPDE